MVSESKCKQSLVKTASKDEKKKKKDDVVTDAGGREFGTRKGLEGPFKTKLHHGVYYYDPKEGKYYCPYTDMYLEGTPSDGFGRSENKKASTNIEELSIYDVICKDGENDKVLSVIASSLNDAFIKAESLSEKYNINWQSSEIVVEASCEPWSDVLKLAKRRHEPIPLELAIERLVKSHIERKENNVPEEDDENKMSVYLGQIHVIMDVIESATGHEINREDLLDAIAKEAAKHKVDLEIGGHPEEAYLLMDRPMMDELKTAAKKKKSTSSKNKPTNPSLWARAKAAAKAKFKVYPSAYANLFASKWYKQRGGGWRKGKKK